MSPAARTAVRLVLGLAGALGAAWLLGGCTVPILFTVNATVDAVDADPGDGACETATPGECTLRAAVQEANALDVPVEIELGAATTYSLADAITEDDVGAVGDLDITGNITIDGNDSVLHAGRYDDLAFDNWGSLRIRDLEIRRGNLSAVRNRGDLALEDVEIPGLLNMSPAAVGVDQIGGTLVMTRTVVHLVGTAGLRVTGGSAFVVDSAIHTQGVYLGSGSGAIRQLAGDLLVVNSTLGRGEFLYHNTCFPSDCSILMEGPGFLQEGGSAILLRTTISTNTIGIMSAGDVALGGTVVANNSGPDCTGPITSLGYNLDEDGTCLAGTPGPNAVGQPSGLGDLGQDDRFLVPPTGSPLVDRIPAGVAFLCTAKEPSDQRGEPRPSGPKCDIGAVERQPSDP